MMDYLVLAGCGLTRSDAAKVLPPVLLVCQRGCKQSANPLHQGYQYPAGGGDCLRVLLAEHEATTRPEVNTGEHHLTSGSQGLAVDLDRNLAKPYE